VTISGAAAVELDPVTLTATGGAGLAGAAAITFDPFTLTASGAVTLAGAGALTLDPFSLAASGAVLAQGAGAITLDPFSLAAAGLVFTPVPATDWIAWSLQQRSFGMTLAPRSHQVELRERALDLTLLERD